MKIVTEGKKLTTLRAGSAPLFPNLPPAQFNACMSKVKDTIKI
jgi:hypothetical protein